MSSAAYHLYNNNVSPKDLGQLKARVLQAMQDYKNDTEKPKRPNLFDYKIEKKPGDQMDYEAPF